MTTIDHHLYFAAELGVWREVLAHLPADHLLRLRFWLKLPAHLELTADRPLLEVQRAGLLADVCDRLVNEFEHSRYYLAAVGDALPSAPDDLSSLTDDQGSGDL